MKFYSVLKKILLVTFFIIIKSSAYSQCTVASANGWTASISITPVKVLPEFINCPYYYHYEIQYTFKITFSGSTNNRSLSCNVYFNCTGGAGGQPYNSGGTYTANTTTTLQTNNSARQYTAISTNNYGSNPSCTQVTLANVNCNTVRIDYWGSGVTSGSLTCSLSSPLPVSLLYFNSEQNNEGVNLNWATASERNNDFFTVERSDDGSSFEDILKIKGAGNSTHLLYYSALDKKPIHKVVYYRLRQTDLDGEFSFSPIIAIQASNKDPLFTVMTNPANSKLIFSYKDEINRDLSVSIYDSKGRQALDKYFEINEGINILEMDINSLTNGIYFIIFNDKLGSIHKAKFIKV